LIYM